MFQNSRRQKILYQARNRLVSTIPYYNLDTLCRTQIEYYSEDDETTDSKLIEDAFENDYWPDRLVGARRWYMACPVFIDVCHFCDIWVYRDNNFGDLREGEQMFKAHRHLLKLMYHFDERYLQENKYAFEAFGRTLSGVAWREQVLNGRKWLSYQEYSRGCFWGESWIAPIGPEHYISVRMYMMEKNNQRKYSEAIKQYIERIMDGVRISTDDSVLDLTAKFESREHELIHLDDLSEVKRYRKHIRRFESSIGAEKNGFTDDVCEDDLGVEEDEKDLQLNGHLENEVDDKIEDALLLEMDEIDDLDLDLNDYDGINNFSVQPDESKPKFDGVLTALMLVGLYVLLTVFFVSIIRGGLYVMIEYFDSPLTWIGCCSLIFKDPMVKWINKRIEGASRE